MQRIPLTLLAETLSDQNQRALFKWGFILIVAILIGAGAIMLIRRIIKDPIAPGAQDPGFSLSDLRDMRDRGEISPEEYEQTRARVIAKVKAMSNEPKPQKKSNSHDDEGYA